MSINGTNAGMAAQGWQVNKLEAEKRALAETVDLLWKHIWQQFAGKFIGKWKHVEQSSTWHKYIEQFGRSFFLCLSIRSIGKIIIVFCILLFHFRIRWQMLQNYPFKWPCLPNWTRKGIWMDQWIWPAIQRFLLFNTFKIWN